MPKANDHPNINTAILPDDAPSSMMQQYETATPEIKNNMYAKYFILFSF